jgi:hypothetical protein
MLRPLNTELLTATTGLIASAKTNSRLEPADRVLRRVEDAEVGLEHECHCAVMQQLVTVEAFAEHEPSMNRMRCTAFWASASDAIPRSSKRPLNLGRVRLHRARGSEPKPCNH